MHLVGFITKKCRRIFAPSGRRHVETHELFLLYRPASQLRTEGIYTLYAISFPQSQLLLYLAGIAQYCN